MKNWSETAILVQEYILYSYISCPIYVNVENILLADRLHALLLLCLVVIGRNSMTQLVHIYTAGEQWGMEDACSGLWFEVPVWEKEDRPQVKVRKESWLMSLEPRWEYIFFYIKLCWLWNSCIISFILISIDENDGYLQVTDELIKRRADTEWLIYIFQIPERMHCPLINV